MVGLAFGVRSRHVVESSLDELTGLAVTAGASVLFRSVQERQNPSPAQFLGRGKVETLAAACDEEAIDLVIVDAELTPVQLRNLDAALPCRVVDRTQLILDIFAARARTREGRLQVELAQLKYLLPRLTGAGVALSRLGAGIGTRGPGETKLESDRRRIRYRITRLTRELDAVRLRRARSRDRRQKDAVPTVALVGYTNAGKTSLFNRLTRSDALASNKLFATLDPLVRPIRLPDRQAVLLSDTVGFIDRLPHTLVAAFRATLEEVAEADLLLHVVDASHPARDERMAAVHRVLEEVGCDGLPQLAGFQQVRLRGPNRPGAPLAGQRRCGVHLGSHRFRHGRPPAVGDAVCRVGYQSRHARIRPCDCRRPAAAGCVAPLQPRVAAGHRRQPRLGRGGRAAPADSPAAAAVCLGPGYG